MPLRQRILNAAARVFAETGYRGATTRRIAEEASVNEVTLFRHFGSKDELIREALRDVGRRGEFPRLPSSPSDPRTELVDWCTRHLAHLYEVRSMIRTCMGESEEHPEVLACATERPVRVREELRTYLGRVKAAGLASPDFDEDVTAALLMGALFTDAMGRDLMPESFPFTSDEAPARYVDFVLRAIGVPSAERKRSGRAGR